MKIREYDEVDPEQVLELNTLCFRWLLTPELVRTIRKIDKRVPGHFALYAVENDAVLSQVGYAVVRTETTGGNLALGYVSSVCTRPNAAQRGIARQLLLETHERLLGEGVRYAMLGTGKSIVAYALYRRLGYRDFIGYSRGLKRCASHDAAHPDITFTTTDKERLFVDIFRAYAKGLLGFVHRPRKFIRIRKAWSWLPLNLFGVFRRDAKPIGYVIANRAENTLWIKELCCPNLDDLQGCITTLEHEYLPQYMLYEGIARRSIRDAFGRSGFKDLGDTWGMFMVADLRGENAVEPLQGLYDIEHDRLQMTDIDSY